MKIPKTTLHKINHFVLYFRTISLIKHADHYQSKWKWKSASRHLSKYSGILSLKCCHKQCVTCYCAPSDLSECCICLAFFHAPENSVCECLSIHWLIMQGDVTPKFRKFSWTFILPIGCFWIYIDVWEKGI